MKSYIYTLQDPITGLIRYVGKTSDTGRRYIAHLSPSNLANKKKAQWVSALKKLGEKPILDILETVEGNGVAEEMFWIYQFKSWGFDLLNVTPEEKGVLISKANKNVAKKEQHKRKLRESLSTGNYVVYKNGIFIGSWKSPVEASINTGIPQTSIHRLSKNGKTGKHKDSVLHGVSVTFLPIPKRD